jgi:predicted acylesterase/phospholipase RssA
MIERRSFLVGLGAAGLSPALLGASADEAALEPLERALVLSGGGARGAYQAGIVGALAADAQISDGSPLRPYEIVCGTSIGALNGWFVATGQYTKLRELWYGISGEHVIQWKPQYAALRDSQSGVLDRAASAIRLIGLARNESGLLQSEPVYDWISRHVDPSTPLLTPLVWAVTNLAQQRPEYFFVRPNGRGQELPERVVHALQVSLGPETIAREATPELLHRALFASAALPIVFDPVIIPGPDGSPNPYCDGGVASNSPVGIAHAVSKAADVVLMDPRFEPETNYQDAIGIAYGVFGTMQRKILEVEMRTAYFQSIGKRAFQRLTPEARARATQGNSQLAPFLESIPETDLWYIRPQEKLPLSVVGFNDEVGIGKAYRIGWEDRSRGFTQYDWRSFAL